MPAVIDTVSKATVSCHSVDQGRALVKHMKHVCGASVRIDEYGDRALVEVDSDQWDVAFAFACGWADRRTTP